MEGWLANSGSGKVTQYSNYDEIVFYMNATYLTRSGKITPPYITLAHELRHWWQHSQIRKLKNTMIYDAEHEVPGEKYLNADFHDDSLYWKDAREILENTKEKQLSPHSNSISDKEDDAHSFEKIVLGDLHLPLDLVPHKYHDYRAKIIVDDPIRPVRILRKLLPKK